MGVDFYIENPLRSSPKNKMPKIGKKTSPLVSAHFRLRKRILASKKLSRDDVMAVAGSLSAKQRTQFTNLHGPICDSERVAVIKLKRNNVGVRALKVIQGGTRLKELKGKFSIRVPGKDNAEEKSNRLFQYSSVVQRKEKTICERFLIGPLAFVNASCEKHSNTKTMNFSCLTTQIDKTIKKNKDVAFFYGEDCNMDTLCDECEKESKIKNRVINNK